MRISNSIKLFFIAGALIFNKRVIAINCKLNNEKKCFTETDSATNTNSLIPKDNICYNKDKEQLYKIIEDDGTCIALKYDGNVFITNENTLTESKKDSIAAGYNCNNGICTTIKGNGLYDTITFPNWYIYYNADDSKPYEAIKYAVYYLKDANIITCGNNKLCKITNADDKSHYINHDDENLITCTKIKPETEITCKQDTGSGYYINSGPDKSINPLILCESGKCTSTSKEEVYLINSGSTTPNYDSLIYCSKDSCSTAKTSNNQYYLGFIDDNSGLISCTDEKGCIKCENISDGGYYMNSGINENIYPLIYCSAPSICNYVSIDEPGYYLDSGTLGNVFYCSNNSCHSEKIDSDENQNTPGKCFTQNNYFIMVGNYNEKDKDYDNIYATGDENLYYYANIELNSGFPGITNNIKTLFRITSKTITRVSVDGILLVNDETHKIKTNPTSFSNGDSLFKCKKNKMLCTKINSCDKKTYFLDIENKTGFVCNNNKLQLLSSGYYIDSGRSNGASRNNYLIYCKSENDCISVANPTNYYINGGRSPELKDENLDTLIHCKGNICITTSGISGGHYVAGGNDYDDSLLKNGYIYCTSPSHCENRTSNNEIYFLNSDKYNTRNTVIKCSSGNCQVVDASHGYFVSENPEELISCEIGGICSIIKPSTGFYYIADDGSIDGKRKIIECTSKTKLICAKVNAEKGYYISNISNILINCTDSICKPIYVKNGIFRSATTTTMAANHSSNKRDTQIVYNIISCSDTGCVQLSTSELAAIPICTFQNNKCFINDKLTSNTENSVTAGGYCTNSDHSIIYFATDTIVVDPEIIDGTTSIYVTTTTTSNCIEVADEYSSYFYTVNGSIYRVGDCKIVQETRSGYYFINVMTNTLANGINIENYNNPNVKLFKCNDNNCYMVDTPTTLTYYTDVNKRIIAYNPNNESYFFPYEEDIKCIYNNSKCTPNADLKGREFCITYKGELVLASTDIKSRESGDCYKSNNIISYIFGSAKYLYEMNSNSAQTVETTGYYIVSLATNSTASFRDYNSSVNVIKIYGCTVSTCKEYQPKEGIYYYDYLSKSMYKYEDGFWSTPSISGYAMASIYPNESYIYKFSTSMNRVTLEGKAISGYYYTVDNEMYDCDENTGCAKISNNGYYFTNNGEMFYCLYDSEGIEKTYCVKQNCNIGEYYFIDGIYYRCESGSIYNYISAKYCNYNERVVVNFPTAINSNYPPEIHEAINNISEKNNSTAIINNSINNYLTVIPGIFTNCTYNNEEKSTKFDLLCINNFVTLDEEKVAQICSVEQLGYVECVEDESNKKKCNPSSAFAKYTMNLGLILFISIIYFIFNTY